MRRTTTLGGVLLIGLLVRSGPVFAQVLFEDGFDSDYNEFSDQEAWHSSYCDDPWTTAWVEGVAPWQDDGCERVNCASGPPTCDYGFGVFGTCGQSDPFDGHLTAGDLSWTDYIFEVSLRNDDDDTFGVVFRYVDAGNFYLVTFSYDLAPNPQDGCSMQYEGAQVWRVRTSADGLQTDTQRLAQVAGPTYTPGLLQRVRVVALGTSFDVWIDRGGDGTFDDPDDRILSFVDDSPDALRNGRIGLYAYQNGWSEEPCLTGSCYFDDVIVYVDDTILDPDSDGTPSTIDNCPDVANADQRDSDGDSLGDACEDDDDNDGLSDDQEAALGSLPTDADSDDDGLSDGEEPQPTADADHDGLSTILDPDSDNDGLWDGLEAGVTVAGNGTDVQAGHFTADADPLTQTSLQNADSDGDDLADGAEDSNRNGRVDEGETNPLAPNISVVEPQPDAIDPRDSIDAVLQPVDAVEPSDVATPPADGLVTDSEPPPADQTGAETPTDLSLSPDRHDADGIAGPDDARPISIEPFLLPSPPLHESKGCAAAGADSGIGLCGWLLVLLAGVRSIRARRRAA